VTVGRERKRTCDDAADGDDADLIDECKKIERNNKTFARGIGCDVAEMATETRSRRQAACCGTSGFKYGGGVKRCASPTGLSNKTSVM